jgi:hypothetical protein
MAFGFEFRLMCIVMRKQRPEPHGSEKGMAFGYEFRLMFHRTSEKKIWQVAARSRNRLAQSVTLRILIKQDQLAIAWKRNQSEMAAPTIRTYCSLLRAGPARGDRAVTTDLGAEGLNAREVRGEDTGIAQRGHVLLAQRH